MTRPLFPQQDAYLFLLVGRELQFCEVVTDRALGDAPIRAVRHDRVDLQLPIERLRDTDGEGMQPFRRFRRLLLWHVGIVRPVETISKIVVLTI